MRKNTLIPIKNDIMVNKIGQLDIKDVLMSHFQLSNSNELKRIVSLNLENDFKFIIDNNYYYLPSALAENLSKAVYELHLVDVSITSFLIKDVDDSKLYFELFMELASGFEIEINQDNCLFLLIVSSLIKNDEIFYEAEKIYEIRHPITELNVFSRINKKDEVKVFTYNEIAFVSEYFWKLDPYLIFQMSFLNLSQVLSHPKLKVISENWLFQIIIHIIQEKGDEFQDLISNVSFSTLNYQLLTDFLKSNNFIMIEQEERILKLIEARLDGEKLNYSDRHHIIDECEYYFMYKNSHDNMFNQMYFKENPPYFDISKFESSNIIPPEIDNNKDTESLFEKIFIRKNPFRPFFKKIFPDYISTIAHTTQEETQFTDENKHRIPLIKNDEVPPLKKSIDIIYNERSEQIPINFLSSEVQGFNHTNDNILLIDENNPNEEKDQNAALTETNESYHEINIPNYSTNQDEHYSNSLYEYPNQTDNSISNEEFNQKATDMELNQKNNESDSDSDAYGYVEDNQY